MIIDLFIATAIVFVGAVLDALQLPVVTTLPTINGFDIDTALVSGMGMFYQLSASFWLIRDGMIAFLVFFAYLVIKVGLKFLLGSRAPGQ